MPHDPVAVPAAESAVARPAWWRQVPWVLVVGALITIAVTDVLGVSNVVAYAPWAVIIGQTIQRRNADLPAPRLGAQIVFAAALVVGLTGASALVEAGFSNPGRVFTPVELALASAGVVVGAAAVAVLTLRARRRPLPD